MQCKLLTKMKKLIFYTLLTLFSILVLLLTVHGRLGNPTEETLNDDKWLIEGPFELSPERGRFALIYSLVESKTAKFSLPLARFTTPDLGYTDGEFVSLFAHGVSFISIPGYVVGKALGASQVGAFLTSLVFAVLNFVLIRSIARKLKVPDIPASIGSLIFLFATPAFSYATTLYQHHITTFLILLSLYSLLRFSDLKALIIVFFLYALGLSVDYPNALMLMPLVIYSLVKFKSVKVDDKKTVIRINWGKFIALLAVIPPLLFFLWFNNYSYGSPFQLAGTIESVDSIDEKGFPVFEWQNEVIEFEEGIPLQESDTALGFFDTRNIRNGLYIHLLSPDRGIIFFAPILIFAVLGYSVIKKANKGITLLIVSIIGINLIIYSMWGDPWGGWAFGSRYLIPGYAMASILVAGAIPKVSKRPLLIGVFFIVLTYSIAVNSLGAATSIKNPPKHEIQELQDKSGKEEKYTMERNFDYLNAGKSQSFVYGLILSKYMSSWSYYFIVSSSIVLVVTSLFAYMVMSAKEQI